MEFWIFLAIVVALVVWGISIYNGLVQLRNRFKNAFAQIDVQLKRRYDLIPNLVETVKGYIKHERETLEAVIKARNQAVGAAQAASAAPGNPAAMQALAQAEGALTGVLGRMFALAEAYPDLKADTSFVGLQTELSQLETDTLGARRYFNAVVRDYNTALETFPSSLVATLGAFRPHTFFQLDQPADRQVPRVSFGT